MSTPPKHEAQWIQKEDEQGIVQIGLSWHERQPKPGQFLCALAGFMLLPTLFFLAGGMLGWKEGGLLFLLCLGIALALFWFGVTLHGPHVPRALVFVRGGKMLIPNGMPRLEHLTEIGGSHDFIVSIESHLVRNYGDPRDDYYSVRMICANGSMIVVTRNLLEEEAMVVAVQLSNALQMLRRQRGEVEVEVNVVDPPDARAA
jgi:hypothetical protein